MLNLRSENEEITPPIEIFETIQHEELIKSLLLRVRPVDFLSRVAQTGVQKVKRKHLEVIVVEEVLALARQHRWGLCRKNGSVYLYNGAYWKAFEEDALKRFLGEAAERMGVDVLEARHHEFRRALSLQFEAAASMPSPPKSDDGAKINLLNGTLEISAKGVRLREHRAEDFLTYQLTFTYTPQATCPLFDQYLQRVLPDAACRDVLAEFIGYVFVKNSTLKLEKALLLYGDGANGKSVFFEVLSAMLGKENVSNFPLHKLASATNEYYRAMIEDKLVNYGTEIKGSMDAGLFKQLASGEPVDCRPIYGKPYSITNYAKLIFNCNKLPHDVEHTTGFFRRFIILPFNITIPVEERNPQLPKIITDSELSGVLNWSLKGLQRLLEQRSFTQSQFIDKEVNNFRIESDSVESYLIEQEYKPDPYDVVSLAFIYENYRACTISDGKKPISKPNFRKRLESLGFTVIRRSMGVVVLAKQVNPSSEATDVSQPVS